MNFKLNWSTRIIIREYAIEIVVGRMLAICSGWNVLNWYIDRVCRIFYIGDICKNTEQNRNLHISAPMCFIVGYGTDEWQPSIEI